MAQITLADNSGALVDKPCSECVFVVYHGYVQGDGNPNATCRVERNANIREARRYGWLRARIFNTCGSEGRRFIRNTYPK